MIIKRAIFFFLIVLSLKATAQSPEWAPAGMPLFGWQVRCIYTDALSNTLYVTGGILTSPGSFSNYYICKYNGSTWSNIGAFNGQILSVANYNGDLIVAGIFSSINSLPFFSIARFDGTNWHTMGNFDVEVTKLKVINSDLYAMGYFNSVDGIPAKRIAKWNGSVWSDVYNFSADTSDGHITDVEIYKGNTYVCGNFSNSALNINHMAVYKSGVWQKVGGGIQGSWNDLAKMLIYKDELYLLGLLLKPANIGNGIQKWNDTAWTEVGDGVQDFTGPYDVGHPGTLILDGVVHNDELYVSGSFGYAGHVPAYNVAKWDGLKWCGLATNGLLSNKALALNFYNDTLYLGIANDTLNSVYTNRIIKYIAGSYVDTCSINYTDINELSPENEFALHPNPVQSIITIELSEATKETTVIQIKNMLGQTIKTLQLQMGNKQLEIDVSQLSKGLYFVQWQSGDRMISKKFMKQ